MCLGLSHLIELIEHLDEAKGIVDASGLPAVPTGALVAVASVVAGVVAGAGATAS